MLIEFRITICDFKFFVLFTRNTLPGLEFEEQAYPIVINIRPKQERKAIFLLRIRLMVLPTKINPVQT